MNKKKKIVIVSIIVSMIVFSIFIFTNYIYKTNKKDIVDTIIIGNYSYMTENKKYIEIITEKWEKLGHNSKLVFKDWECYDELPTDELDVLIYDGVIYKSLRNKDLLENMDNFNMSYTFEWATNLTENDNEIYAVPFLLCSDFLIYNKSKVDLSNVEYLTDINTTFTTQYKSMVLNYYLNTLSSLEKNSQVMDIEKGKYKQEVLEKLYVVADKMSLEEYNNSSSSTYNGIEQMNNGKYNALYGFSESIYKLKNISKDIDIKNVWLTDNSKNKSYYVDFISIKKGASREEKKLYKELIELMISDDVNYKYLNNNNDYLYLISANKNVLEKLSKEDEIYNKINILASNKNNKVFLYGSEYYEEFSLIKDDLKDIIKKYKINMEEN